MQKKEAINLVNRNHQGILLNNQNTCFANINKAKEVWWFDINLKKVSNPNKINLLAYDYKTEVISHLIVPSVYFRDNKEKFLIRQEKNCISLELSCKDTNKFQDIRPTSGQMKFSQFLKSEYGLKVINR